jgi:alkylhydroperoxidase/carboxymuconolactone decarboxylase family protein YurZ
MPQPPERAGGWSRALCRRREMPENPLETLARIDPAMMAHLKSADELVYGAGALPSKVKLLIALALDAAHGAENGVRALARRAVKEGATREEIAEALRVAYHLSGVGALYTASAALQEL